MTTTSRRTAAEVTGYQASPELSADLQRVPVDLIVGGAKIAWLIKSENRKV